MKIQLKIDGHNASSNNVGAAVEDAIVAKVKEQMTQKLANLRCPQHDQVPKLEIEGNSLKSLKIQVHACCDYMRGEAQRVLNAK